MLGLVFFVDENNDVTFTCNHLNDCVLSVTPYSLVLSPLSIGRSRGGLLKGYMF